MKNLFFLFALLALVSPLSGQKNYLLLTRGKHQQYTRKINEGKILYVKFISEKGIIHGQLEILSDSIISVGRDSVFINQIKKIRVRTTGSYVMGAAVIAASIGVSILGVYMVSDFIPFSHDPNPFIDAFLIFYQCIGVMLGISVVAGGVIYVPLGILIAIWGHGFKTYGKHCFSVKVVHGQTDIPLEGNLAWQQDIKHPKN